MIRADARSRRVAIVPDYLVNPGSALYQGVAGHARTADRPPAIADLLVEDGWGLMKPPPHVVGPAIGRPAVDVIAADTIDYRHHGYDVVILAADGLPAGGVWLDLLEAAFRDLNQPLPPVVRIGLPVSSDDATPSTLVAVRDALAAATKP